MSAHQVREVTSDEVDHFADDGWAFLPQLVPSELASEMLAAAQQSLAKQDTGSELVADYGWWQNFRFLASELRLEPFASVVLGSVMRRNVQRMTERGASTSGDPPSGPRGDDVVIGVAARLEWVKGIDVLLEALALLDPAGCSPKRPTVLDKSNFR